jgi:hypothetical protein
MKSQSTAKKRIILAAIVLAAAFACVCFAASMNTHPTPPIIIAADETPQQCFAEATRLLSIGKSTPRAIALLKRALKSQPNNIDYHEALASAYTYRASVIYRALYFRSMIETGRSQYPTDLMQWEWRRVTKQSFPYDSRPVEQAYHLIHFKDDGTPFFMSDDKASAEIVSLVRQANSEWIIAEQEARSPAAQGYAHYGHAWTDRVFGRSDNDLYTGNMKNMAQKYKALLALPSEADAENEIADATRLDPKNPAYWQAAGDLAPYQSDQSAYANSARPGTAALPSSNKYYLQSLKLQPKNEQLWLKVAADDTRNFKAAESADEGAISANPRNAYSLLMCATYILKQSHYEQNSMNSPDPDHAKIDAQMVASLNPDDLAAVGRVQKLVHQAAAANAMDVSHYEPKSPPLLRRALDMPILSVDEFEFGNWGSLRDGARDMCGVAIGQALHKDPESGVRLMSDLAAAVQPKCTADNFTKQAVKSNDIMTTFVCEAVQQIALHEKEKLCAQYCSREEADEAAKERSAARALFNVNRRKVQRYFTITNDDIFQFY